MIERYTRPEMGRIWSEETKYETWLEVEILTCEAWADAGKIPRKAVGEIRNLLKQGDATKSTAWLRKKIFG